MKNLCIFLVILFGFACKSNCQMLHFNKCPNVTTIKSFDLDKYMGTWYLHSKHPAFLEVGQNCQKVVYKNEGNGTIAVFNTGVIKGLNRTDSTIGTGKVIEPGQLAISYKNKTVNTPNYLILGTDYNNWAVVYRCKKIGLIHRSKLLWILTRRPQALEETLAAAKQILEKNKLNLNLIETSQKECPKLPDPYENYKQTPEASSTTINSDSQSSTDSLVTSTERLMDDA